MKGLKKSSSLMLALKKACVCTQQVRDNKLKICKDLFFGFFHRFFYHQSAPLLGREADEDTEIAGVQIKKVNKLYEIIIRKKILKIFLSIENFRE